MTIISSQQQSESKIETDEFSRQQPAWHVLVLGSLTAGIYLLYWAHKTWSLLKKQANNGQSLDEQSGLSIFKDISPGWRTIALASPPLIGLLPLLADILKFVVADSIVIYVGGTLIIGVSALHPNSASLPRRHPLLATGLVLGTGLVLAGLARVPGPMLLISLLSGAVPCAVIQDWLNQYWKSTEAEGLVVRHGFNFWELLAIVVGGAFVGMVAAGMMMGIKPN